MNNVPYVAGSATSHDAAESVKPKAATYREQVYRVIEMVGPVTDEQIANVLGMNPSTARPRRLELLRAGRIRAALVTQMTSSGRRAVAWEVAP